MTEQEMTGGDTLSTVGPSKGQSQDLDQQLVGQRDFKEECFALRTELETLKRKILSQMGHQVFDENNPVDQPHLFGEMKANVMLAYRHLEDARMRIGKAIQAFDGGKSCYPR